MTQQTFKEVIDDELSEAINIAEEELGHDIYEAYANATGAQRKKAERILRDILALHDDPERDADDKSIVIFAKVLKLETVLGVS